ncbi:MAG: hypothetical protein M3Q58_08630 [Bacteroidota bacterium]|nr:hypothetical protein [Bacteroidota bacterium]
MEIRLREYGQFESEFLESRQRRPDLTREEFLANNPRRYSNLESPGLRVSNEIAREFPELQARAPQTQRPNGERTESRDKFNDIYRPREPDRKNQPEPDRRTQPSPDREEQYPDKRFQPEQDRRAQPSPDRRFRPAPERTPPRERRVEPRPRQESRPSPAPTPTPQTPSTPAPRTPSEPAPRSTPRTAPTPPSRTAPSTSPISGSNTAIEKRTPGKTISLSKEIPSYMQKIDRAIEYHNRNWRINNKN